MSITPEAKKLLAETIRGTAQAPEKGLRGRLLRAIHDEADRRYRLSVRIEDAGLDEAHRQRRARIAGWIDEQARASQPGSSTKDTSKGQGKTKPKTTDQTANGENKEGGKKSRADLEARLLAQAEKEAAATLINRLVLLRQLEAAGLSRPVVVTGGWNSRGYREFRDFAPTLCTNGTTDATEGYATLLQLLFDELAGDLPGLFGDVGLTRLFPVPAATLREVIERLDDPALASAWTDDTTLGWVYQYWNDPDREFLDAKINGGGKIAPHEIASKTQMFTERYMVEWLLQNSLGLTWLCICRKNGWTADVERVLPLLEARRVQWRQRREAGEVALDALMPIEGQLEDHWKYYLPQPIPEEAIKTAPDGVRALKLLDPAVGSGHFLVIAFDMLVALYSEEARHRAEEITDRDIAESILTHNLHGIDIDSRAIQIAAAGLYLKAKSLAKDARPRTMNLVAPVLQLGNLPPDDPAVVQLRNDLKREVGIPEELTDRLLAALAGVDYLGSLLKVDAAVEEAIRAVELELVAGGGQGDLLSGAYPARQTKLSVGEAKATILDRLEAFLAQHSSSQDLGLRLDGQQLAAGVRFVRMAREGTYDVVVANPPYQGLSKTERFGYVTRTYERGKADLYAAFLERALQLTRRGGSSALVTMRGWMFLNQFREIREHLLRDTDLRALADLDSGAFEEISAAQVVVSVACAVFVNANSTPSAVALRPTPVEDKLSSGMANRKRAGLLAHVGRYEFDPRGFEAIQGKPLLYWWSKARLQPMLGRPLIGKIAQVKTGLQTSQDTRFLRRPWEVRSSSISLGARRSKESWAPVVAGASGKKWIEPLDDIVRWECCGLEVRAFSKSYPRNMDAYFRGGVAFADTGTTFAARLHSFKSIIGDKGPSVVCAVPDDSAAILCAMNRSESRELLESLNPGTDFQVGDVERLPFLHVHGATEIVSTLIAASQIEESTREPSLDFRRPGPSPWPFAQRWAQRAVDRSDGELLPAYDPQYESVPSTRYMSFSMGVTLGRFYCNGKGVCDVAPSVALPEGILFITVEKNDSLDHPACAPLHTAWSEHGAAVGKGDDLRTYLRKSFFEYHKKLYEHRPIYLPLSSARRSFVAFVSIHRWQDDTLNVLLADQLVPARRGLEGELEDLRGARATGDAKGKGKGAAERRFADVQKLLEELNDFIANVAEIAEKGPPPPDDKTPAREVDARYAMDLDDGVMVNSAALWPLLEPQWKDPKKWWRELATGQGKKDYDWSHLAARYFPARARAKCHDDPSLAVAHKCFWELHPAKAYAWELRLQDEIRPDFTIDEPHSDPARARFLSDHPQEASALRTAETKRRARRSTNPDPDESENGPLFADEESETAVEV